MTPASDVPQDEPGETARRDVRATPQPTGDAPRSPVPATRRAAAMLAAGMFAIDEVMGRKRREEAPIVVDANGQPVDIDTDGIEVHVAGADGGEVAVAAPALPRSRPAGSGAVPSSRRRRGRRAV